MNLFTHGCDLAAEMVKRKLIAERVPVTVHVNGYGDVGMESRIGAPEQPAEWLIGVYGQGATTQNIRDDLDARLTELRILG